MLHLPHDQFFEAKQVLSDFKDVFSVSNTQIGCANISSFDGELEHNHSISISVSVVLHSVLSNVSSFKPNFQTLVISLTMVPTELTQAESKQLQILQLHRMLNHGPILWMLHLQFFCHICTPSSSY